MAPDLERGFTHLDPEGRAQMVNVSQKAITHRQAKARAYIEMKPETATAIRDQALEKGDVLAVARIAGIQGAKNTSLLIPLCHPLALHAVRIHFAVQDEGVLVECEVDATDRTGVEMEALSGASVAALTIYDMCKAIDKDMVIGHIALWEKRGGRSGNYVRAE